jgi:formylglycine-generating enzyme
MRSYVITRLAASGVFTALTACVASAQISIPTVTINNPGIAADPTTGYGLVAYTYNIGTYEVTNAQYASFLNAKAASDPFGLYNTSMASLPGGITRSGSPGSYLYNTISGRENHPVNFVSFWDACRFANWLHNGQGSGDTETGAYTLTANSIANNTVTRNAGWHWAVTSEDEWYKAAYNQPASQGGDIDSYWLYPTSSNSVPTTAQANFGSMINDTTPVGSYAPNFYAAFDMGGNIWEWNEAIITSSNRGLRGGWFNNSDLLLRSVHRNLNANPIFEFGFIGFRISQPPTASCPCPADFDQSGGTPDINDIDAYFTAWLAGEPTADADCSGGTPDINDIDAFFAAWLAGGC